MNRSNLSEWTIRHRSLVTYFMLIVLVGIGAYLWLGRSEDPGFTFQVHRTRPGCQPSRGRNHPAARLSSASQSFRRGERQR